MPQKPHRVDPDKCMWNKKYKGYCFRSIYNELEVALNFQATPQMHGGIGRVWGEGGCGEQLNTTTTSSSTFFFSSSPSSSNFEYSIVEDDHAKTDTLTPYHIVIVPFPAAMNLMLPHFNSIAAFSPARCETCDRPPLILPQLKSSLFMFLTTDNDKIIELSK